MMLHVSAPGALLARSQRLAQLRQPAQRSVRRGRARAAPRADKQQAHAAQDSIKAARMQQLQATDMLAKLLQAPRPESVAAEHIESLNEEFFMMSSTYLDMARKEGNADVCAKLEQVLRIAMEEKQKTLRPEIQLLNALLACQTPAERKQVFAAPETPERLTMNDRYFFRGLLDRMIQDVGRQQVSAKQAELSMRLHQLKAEAEHIVKLKSK